MEKLNEREWRKIQNKVKKIDNRYANHIKVNVSVATLIINTKKDYSDVIFDEPRQ